MIHLVDDFERQLVREGKSPSTIKSYRWALDDFTRFLLHAGVLEASDLAERHLEVWQDEMIARGVRPRSRGLAVTAVRGFVRFLARRRHVDPLLEQALPRVRVPRGLPRPLSPEDLDLLRAWLTPRRPRMSIVDLRDRALFFYLVGSGARVSEALQVTKHELHHALVIQKGGSQKVLRVPPIAEQFLAEYLEARNDDVPWLWVTFDANRPMRRLNPDGVREIWKRLARRVGIAPFTTHQLRHTTATVMLEAGIPELVIAEHLGHHDLSTIRNYGLVRERQRQLGLDALQAELSSVPAVRPRLLPRLKRRGRRTPRAPGAPA